MSSTPRWIRALIGLYPRSFRARHGEELADLYRRLYADRGLFGAARALMDTLYDASGAHLDARARRRQTPSRAGAPPRRSRIGFAPIGLELRQAARALARRPPGAVRVGGDAIDWRLHNVDNRRHA